MLRSPGHGRTSQPVTKRDGALYICLSVGSADLYFFRLALKMLGSMPNWWFGMVRVAVKLVSTLELICLLGT